MSEGEIVNFAEYEDGKRVRDIHFEDVPAILADEEDSHFVWIGLHEPSEATLLDVQRAFGLHDLAVEDATRAHQRPKLEEYGEGLFVVLRTAIDCEGEGNVAFGETHIFVGPGYVVALRHGPSLPYVEVRKRCECTPQLLKLGPSFVLYALMDFIVDHYFPIVDSLEDDLEQLEEEIFSGTPVRETTERIYRLKRELLAVKRGVSPLTDVCNRLVRFDVGLVREECRPYFRDIYDHAVRLNETVDGLRELLNGALEANISLISVSQNEVTKKLASWAAILAVPTMIAGIYGMNFDEMPELKAPWGYPAVMTVMVVACISLYVFFKRSEWL